MKNYFLTICMFCFCPLIAETPYHVSDLGLANTEQCLNADINQAGLVVGQHFINEPVDYLWEAETGLQEIASGTVKGNSPKINNKGQIAGVLVQKSNSWWSSDVNKVSRLKRPSNVSGTPPLR